MVREGKSGIFIDAERVHHMNGTVALLRAIPGAMNEVVSYGQRTLVVAGAHNGFMWAWRTRDGYLLGLESCVPVLPSARRVAHIRL
jgi:hypothetical protein